VKYYAVTEDMKKLPKGFKVNIPSALHASDNAADCLIITNSQFVDNEGTLLYKQLWENLGYQVNIINIQDVYDEFNFGIKSATALKDFITYAYNDWSEPQLKSVILLGDGTDDERDFSATRKYNIVPVKKIWTYKHGATASDNWYGCVVGNDPIPDISISRINVWKPEQILAVAQKSQTYLNQANYNNLWHGHIILSSGGKESDQNDQFSQQSEYIRRSSIPKYYRTSRVYTNTQTVSSDYWGGTNILMSKINDGAIYLQFMGHGGGRIWADYNLFNLNNVSSLNNQNYPIVSSLACYCSAFDTSGSSSISEALVLEPGKGAIATIGFSGLGYLYDDINFSLALTEGLFTQDFDNLGDALNFTKAKFYVNTSGPAQQALTQGCAVLGDANIRVIKPSHNLAINTNKDNYAVGDTLRVSANFPQNGIAARTFIMKPNEVTDITPYDGPINQGTYNFSYKITGTNLDSYQRRIYVTGFSDQGEYIGYKEISVGRGLIAHLNTIPNTPAWSDSIRFTAKITGINSFENLVCKVRVDSTTAHPTWLTFPMSVSPADSTIYLTTVALPAQAPGKEIFFKYHATTNSGAPVESSIYSFFISGAELIMQDMQFNAQNEGLVVKILIKNIGNTASGATDLKLYAMQTGIPALLLKSRPFSSLAMNEQRWETISIDTLITNNITLEARVNIPRVFPELSYSDENNKMTLAIPMNYHQINSNGGIFTSLDANVSCEVPANLVPPNQNALFYIINLPAVTAKDEPDVLPIALRNGGSSIPFEIKTLNSELVDSSGVFVSGKKLKLTFYYSPTDSIAHQFENEGSFKIYHWEPTFRKWILLGGNISVTDKKVVADVDKQGIFTLLRNRDKVRPSIDVNVQDQEFTVGGYISGKGTISLVLSDANGIDVFDNSIKLFIQGVLVPDNLWVKTVNQDDINRIPIKFQLNLQRGNYTLVVDCKDVNGNFNTRDIQFNVNDKFDVVRVANYPNPVQGFTQDPKNAGRTRFTYVLTDDADDVTIKVFTVAGRLVKNFRNLPGGVGYHEFPRTVYAWDCTDDQGFYLANGVYFYRIIAKKGNKTIEKIQKMAILK
jgi:hypothetical protein